MKFLWQFQINIRFFWVLSSTSQKNWLPAFWKKHTSFIFSM